VSKSTHAKLLFVLRFINFVSKCPQNFVVKKSIVKTKSGLAKSANPDLFFCFILEQSNYWYAPTAGGLGLAVPLMSVVIPLIATPAPTAGLPD
jgi:hypothetical protein